MLDQLRTQYEALSDRVSVLEGHSVLSQLRTDYARLGARVSILEQGSATRRIPSQANMLAVGGWQLDSATPMGYATGSLLVERSGDTLTIYSNGSQKHLRLHRHTANINVRGSMAVDRRLWPIAAETANVPAYHPQTYTEFIAPQGVCRPNGGLLLASSPSSYATGAPSWVGDYLSWIDEAVGPVDYVRSTPDISARPVYAGGFCKIPVWFANQYLGGRTFGVGCGGYRSGQGSSAGPSLFVCDTPADRAHTLNNVKVLLRFGAFNTADASSMERRPGDYSNHPWVPAPDENGLGYFDGACEAGPVWIDTPKFSGLCYWSVHGIGQLDYGLQRRGMSYINKTRLYCYSPETLADVATGRIQPWQARATITEWGNPFDQNSYHYPCGAHWDGINLFVSYSNAGDNQYEPEPVVVMYEVR